MGRLSAAFFLVAFITILDVTTAVQTISASSPLIQWMGRNRKDPSDGSVHFDWLGVGARVSWSGTHLIANYGINPVIGSPYKVSTWELVSNYYVPTGSVWVSPHAANSNNTVSVVVAVNGDESWISLNSPPQYFGRAADPGVDAYIVSFTTDGTFAAQPPAPLRRRIEFVGDSITAATNVHGPPPNSSISCGDGGMQCDYAASWSGQVCAAFHANCSVIAVGGKGLVRNCCDNDLHMPDYFQQLEFSSNTADYTFAETGFIPDAVVLALGTNDYSGSPPANIDQLFIAGYLNFLVNITRWYGASNISFFLCSSPMTSLPVPAILEVIAQAPSRGISNVHFLNVSNAPTDGCAGHPGVLGHASWYESALATISPVMGWST